MLIIYFTMLYLLYDLYVMILHLKGVLTMTSGDV